MSEVTYFSFRMERTSYKSQDLIYEELRHKLVIYLEMSGVEQFDWVGCDTEFQRWGEPHGEPISAEKRAEILSRLAAWSSRERVRIGIGPPMDMQKMFDDMRHSGWVVEKQPDGTVKASRPKERFEQ
jgi:hypothetical protein